MQKSRLLPEILFYQLSFYTPKGKRPSVFSANSSLRLTTLNDPMMGEVEKLSVKT